MINSPFVRKPVSVRSVMFQVLLALVPGIVAYVWFFGAGILVQIALASAAALAGEAAMLAIRGKPKALFLTDLSAVVTAWLIALTFPPIAPWWLTVTGTLLAIVVVKQLYGGLGQNPFNPAMAAFCLMIVAYPALMSQWPAAGQLDFKVQLDLIFGGLRQVDAITGATPLDALRTALRSAANPDSPLHGLRTSHLMDGPAFGLLGGKGSEWIAFGYLLGGLWLIQRRIITWHIPLAFCAALFVCAFLLWGVRPDIYASPLFHLASGGAMLGAFFILTDPVSGATTPRGKLLFAAGAAIFTYTIRAFGAFPDGVAFATLLMNILVPLIDMNTQAPVFGHKKD
ncbi:MAG TPA: RnfABCDGE type electron transport complex subunit D [Zoogloea sp.]|uniref:RnfABCDGE type electron transport complex subunit D n=1 Tax=Zoogloea sp. TaxID=49181 RepID=UPI002C4BDD4C|nr:RnfABCDGE type electron transport complex subunit D [Zoogloea sp.]HOB47400.1 RnfABCDGE type electron transport complex subunit D [Zoogloea sp.]HQA11484.1 RnfABCDGE type electron transport complex subunit D [Zoogloea sp.]HQE41022.1 RnfABCDGE type electron transport complex subunit D [Zoogloea sp.]